MNGKIHLLYHLEYLKSIKNKGIKIFLSKKNKLNLVDDIIFLNPYVKVIRKVDFSNTITYESNNPAKSKRNFKKFKRISKNIVHLKINFSKLLESHLRTFLTLKLLKNFIFYCPDSFKDSKGAYAVYKKVLSLSPYLENLSFNVNNIKYKSILKRIRNLETCEINGLVGKMTCDIESLNQIFPKETTKLNFILTINNDFDANFIVPDKFARKINSLTIFSNSHKFPVNINNIMKMISLESFTFISKTASIEEYEFLSAINYLPGLKILKLELSPKDNRVFMKLFKSLNFSSNLQRFALLINAPALIEIDELDMEYENLQSLVNITNLSIHIHLENTENFQIEEKKTKIFSTYFTRVMLHNLPKTLTHLDILYSGSPNIDSNESDDYFGLISQQKNLDNLSLVSTNGKLGIKMKKGQSFTMTQVNIVNFYTYEFLFNTDLSNIKVLKLTLDKINENYLPEIPKKLKKSKNLEKLILEYHDHAKLIKRDFMENLLLLYHHLPKLTHIECVISKFIFTIQDARDLMKLIPWDSRLHFIFFKTFRLQIKKLYHKAYEIISF